MSPQDTSYEKPSDLFYTASIYQKIAGVLAITGAVVATSMMVTWANTHDTDQAYLGGLNWGRLVFNWHPVLMITGMILCLISSLLMYRINELPKYMTKAMHATIHTAAIICVLTGLSAVVTGNNYTNHSYDYQYVPNLYSLHSLLGMSAMVLYFSNYLLAGFHFLAPGVKLEWKVAFKPNHVFVGVFTLFAATFAVLSGINELSNDVGCIYSVGKHTVLHSIFHIQQLRVLDV